MKCTTPCIYTLLAQARPHDVTSHRTSAILCYIRTYIVSFYRYERTQAEFVTKLPPGKQSTKGVGRTAPDPSEQRITADGVVIPMGKGKPSKTTATSLLYNEYPLITSSTIQFFNHNQFLCCCHDYS